MKHLRLLSAGLVCLAACTTSRDSGPLASVRDSAGVVIVENPAELMAALPALRVDSVAALDVGGNARDASYDLVQIRGVKRFSDGSIAVMNGATSDIRFYDAKGVFVRSVGRRGSGPGEFEGLGFLVRTPGDTLIVFDWSLRRLSLFDRAGASLGLVKGTQSIPLARLPSGEWMVAAEDRGLVINTANQAWRDTLVVVRESSNLDRRLDTVAVVPGGESFMMAFGSGPRMGAIRLPVPFGKETAVIVHHDSLFFGDNAEPQVEVRALDGRLVRIVRWSDQAAPVTAGDLKAFEEERTAPVSNPEVRKAWAEGFARVPKPTVRSYYEGIDVDPEGRLWVLRHHRTAGAPTEIVIFDPAGQALARLALPAAFEPRQVGRDFVLGIEKDDDGLEHVKEYRFIP